jgi:peptidoglycan/xylan/chitin deacetylase (PgdA/CDA1 family)
LSLEDVSKAWATLEEELAHWQEAGQKARLWLRDDDAIAPTPALDRLLAMSRAHQAPLLIAAIPMLAESALAERLAKAPKVFVAAHGIRHENHAPAGRKSEETPIERGEAAIMHALHEASARMMALFGAEAASLYVPPWNRLPREMAQWLPRAGFHWVSAFGPGQSLKGPGLQQANAHVDLMDWRNGRVGRSEAWLAGALASALQEARADNFQPVGVLTHHLVHDSQAWLTLDRLMDRART